MKEFNLTIKSSSGRFTKLDKLYRDFVINSLNKFDEESIGRWEIYNTIINELVDLGNYTLFEEVQYRFTDGENTNLVMLDIIDRLSDDSYIIWLLRPCVQSFIEDDLRIVID